MTTILPFFGRHHETVTPLEVTIRQHTTQHGDRFTVAAREIGGEWRPLFKDTLGRAVPYVSREHAYRAYVRWKRKAENQGVIWYWVD